MTVSSLTAAFNAIRNHADDSITPFGLPTFIDNVPVEGIGQQDPHARITIQSGGSSALELSTLDRRQKTRHVGVVLIRLFYPISQGESAIEAALEAIDQNISSTTSSGVVFRSGSVTRVGRAGQYWQRNLSFRITLIL